MEEFVKLIEQILYMENFNIAVTPDLKQKFVELHKDYKDNVPDKYKSDVKRLYGKYNDGQAVAQPSNVFSFSH